MQIPGCLQAQQHKQNTTLNTFLMPKYSHAPIQLLTTDRGQQKKCCLSREFTNKSHGFAVAKPPPRFRRVCHLEDSLSRKHKTDFNPSTGWKERRDRKRVLPRRVCVLGVPKSEVWKWLRTPEAPWLNDIFLIWPLRVLCFFVLVTPMHIRHRRLVPPSSL